jgi:hypothetical protein
MAHVRKSPTSGPSIDWGPWTAVRFPNEEARDRFFLAVASNVDDGWGAEPALDDGLGAWVRWRPLQFLGLNDIAYAHGGRIVVTVVQRWVM